MPKKRKTISDFVREGRSAEDYLYYVQKRALREATLKAYGEGPLVEFGKFMLLMFLAAVAVILLAAIFAL